MNIQQLLNEQKALEQKVAMLREVLYSEIKAIPQNPDITIIKDKPRIFTIKSSNLCSRSWSPEYYDFEKQIELIFKKIDNCSDIKSINTALIKIIEGKKISFTSGTGLWRHTVSHIINPKVCEWLEKFVVIE